MRVLVTGSSGFIARTLIKKLINEGNVVYGLDIVESDWTKSMVFTPLIGNITDPKYIDPDYGAWWWNAIDVCFHLAAMANVDEVRENREKAFQVNLHGTFNIAEACRKRNIPLLFASTACTYGNTTQHPSTEDGPTFPVDWYGITKRAGEELVKGLPQKYVVMRFGTTYGGEMREALCTSIFLREAMNGKPFTIRGTGNQTRNFIYVEDLTEGCISCMKWITSGGSNEIFNLVGQPSYSINYLADICAELTRTDNAKVYLPERPDDVSKEDISIEKAKRLLKWEPKFDLKTGMIKIYKEWKSKNV